MISGSYLNRTKGQGEVLSTSPSAFRMGDSPVEYEVCVFEFSRLVMLKPESNGHNGPPTTDKQEKKRKIKEK